MSNTLFISILSLVSFISGIRKMFYQKRMFKVFSVVLYIVKVKI